MIRTTRPKYIKCADQEQAPYNNHLADNYPITIDNDNITPWIKQAAEAHLPRKSFSSRPFELSEETERIIEQKRKAAQSGANDEELKPHRKEVFRAIRRVRRQFQAAPVGKDLDIRDQFLGLKMLRRPSTPVPLSMKNKVGDHVPLHKRDQAAAEFLGTENWGEAPNTMIQPSKPI